MISFIVPTKPAWSCLCKLKTYPITLNLFIYHHGTGPGYEFQEFWCWNLVPFLPDVGFQLLKSLWSSLTYFLFNDAHNVLFM